MIRRFLWRCVASVAMLLALAGIPLPGLPTVPFILLSAWAAGKGWPEFELWLLSHPRYGPTIRQWREHGSVPRKAKYLALIMMIFSASLLWLSPAPLFAQILVTSILLGTAVWLWQRPEQF